MTEQTAKEALNGNNLMAALTVKDLEKSMPGTRTWSASPFSRNMSATAS